MSLKAHSEVGKENFFMWTFVKLWVSLVVIVLTIIRASRICVMVALT